MELNLEVNLIRWSDYYFVPNVFSNFYLVFQVSKYCNISVTVQNLTRAYTKLYDDKNLESHLPQL
jgi:hypothetical protein